ncbi:MAG: hypothetical protein ACI3ZL_04165 [Candidatus Cryptobacteroides sp.]
MTKTLKLSVLAMTLIVLVASCDKDRKDGSVPGNYLATVEIGTFGGDTVLISGQASNIAGLASIEIACAAWDIDKVYDIAANAPKVFNYDYRMPIPSTAEFPQEITVTVTDINGLYKSKTIDAKFTPDVTAPVFSTSLSKQIGVELNPETGYGSWEYSVSARDERALSSITLDIPGIGYSKTVKAEGRTANISDKINFTVVETLEVTFTAEDVTGNKTTLDCEIVVTPVEEQDPIEDYLQMYLFDADEDQSQYLDGYWHYMARQEGGYKYTCKIHALKDNSHFYIAPTKSLDGDLFGVSPYVSSKILNKNGYVVPVTIEKAGYYWFYVDILSQTFSISEYETGVLESGPFYISGVGFSNIGDWGATDAITHVDGNIYSIDMGIDGSAAAHQYYFYTTDWATVYRCDEGGEQWFIGASGQCVKFSTDYDGEATFWFDLGLPWGWVTKK